MFSRAPYRSTVAFRKTWLGNFQRRALAVEASAKQEGDISTVFSSLSGGESKPLDKRFALLKQHLIQGNEQKVLESWKRLLRELRKETKVVAEKRSRIIPQIQFQDVQPTLQSADSEAEKRRKAFENEVKKRGVGVITGVIPRDTAREYKYETEEYIQNNPWTKGFPPERPTVYELYFSPAQVKARAHPNLLTAQRYLMSLWHSKDPNAMISTSTALSYADRLRIRQPGDVGFTLGPHVDGGSLERWEPNGYGRGQVYDSIFAGQWEDYNPWESSCRLPAISDLYNGAGACSMFRMFQGWLSMSDTGPQEGTLLVNPLFKLATAYFLLRPFMTSLKQAQIEPSGAINSGFLHENNWMLEPETSSAIQGAGQGVCQEFNVELHPHLDLTNTMVHIPKINPGDYVVWHCDTIHGVDKQHKGTTDSSVVYIPVCPLTESNANYLVRQRETFRSGRPGPDFPGGKGESEHSGRLAAAFLTEQADIQGLRAIGLAPFDSSSLEASEKAIADRANKILGFI